MACLAEEIADTCSRGGQQVSPLERSS